MGLTEGNAVIDEIIGQIGRQQHRIARSGLGFGAVHVHAAHHLGENFQCELDGVHGVKERLLVLLQIAIVGHRQAFDEREQAHEVANETRRLAAREFGDVRILFLRHQRRSSRVRVTQRHERELRAGPKDHIFAQAAEMHADH